ncbi:hypothetical protein BCR43DRAFT_178384 [Syncephalastrum racemosum]|uniref:Uncharacterized protein n=1 Tax=Syncephalastrum racemosum TaxID=13706 RepID=A0A1X2HRA8_SYNRA|nr:hypothetical protein BCR43DRAFT_178384 [Syncephalastrum racemosum]
MSLHSNKSEITVASGPVAEDDKPRFTGPKSIESGTNLSSPQQQQDMESKDGQRRSRVSQSCSAGYNNPDDLRRASYILETAPFPTMGSLDPITRTLSANTQQSTRSAALDDEEKQDISVKEQENNIDDKPAPAIWDQPLPTEGWRNPGWLVVISTFLVNFVVFGNSFSWGIFQEL